MKLNKTTVNDESEFSNFSNVEDTKKVLKKQKIKLVFPEEEDIEIKGSSFEYGYGILKIKPENSVIFTSKLYANKNYKFLIEDLADFNYYSSQNNDNYYTFKIKNGIVYKFHPYNDFWKNLIKVRNLCNPNNKLKIKKKILKSHTLKNCPVEFNKNDSCIKKQTLKNRVKIFPKFNLNKRNSVKEENEIISIPIFKELNEKEEIEIIKIEIDLNAKDFFNEFFIGKYELVEFYKTVDTFHDLKYENFNQNGSTKLKKISYIMKLDENPFIKEQPTEAEAIYNITNDENNFEFIIKSNQKLPLINYFYIEDHFELKSKTKHKSILREYIMIKTDANFFLAKTSQVFTKNTIKKIVDLWIKYINSKGVKVVVINE